METGQYTYLILEAPQNTQQTLDAFAHGKIEIFQLNEFSAEHQILIRKAKEKGIRAIAGDVNTEHIKE